MGLREVKEILGKLPAGDVSKTDELEGALAQCWHELAGSEDGGMTGDRLGRMEQVRWDPPVLSFAIERHGAAALGSRRAEVQCWEVNLEDALATLTYTCRRQIRPMRPRITKAQMAAMAEEIAGLIRCHGTDDRIRWHEDGTVHVVLAKLLPRHSAPKDTLAGRRRRFSDALEDVLAADGWGPVGRSRYVREDG